MIEAKAAAEADKETAKLFDRLKAETASYVRGDDLTVGLVKEDEVLKITEANGKVELELNVPFEDLEEKGYNPVNQLVGYILSGDPTYITSYKNARSIIRKLERDELLEEIITDYLKGKC